MRNTFIASLATMAAAIGFHTAAYGEATRPGAPQDFVIIQCLSDAKNAYWRVVNVSSTPTAPVIPSGVENGENCADAVIKLVDAEFTLLEQSLGADANGFVVMTFAR
jgi:hypothetical protein